MSEENEVVESVVEAPVAPLKKARSEAQMAALEAARQKALQMRAQRKLEKEKVKEEEVVPESVEYVRKTRSQPKQKRRIVVVEDSSSEEEIEVRLPKRRSEPEPQQMDPRFQAAYNKMFSL